MISMQSFDLNLLKTFDTLMETRSVSATARQLSLTQPAVSNALARLRGQLEDPLLVRTKQGMEPTPRALSLRGPVKESLKTLEQALLPAQTFDASATDREFKIAAPDFIAAKLLAELLPRWQSEAPGVRLRVLHLGPEVPAQNLEAGDVDLAIGRFLDVPSRLRRQSLSREQLVCLLPDQVDMPNGGMSLQLFLEQTFVWVSNSGRRGMVDRWLQQQNKERAIAAVVSSYTSGAMLVSDGNYAMVVASSYAEYFSERLAVKGVPLRFSPGEFSIDMLWHAYTEGDAALKWLRREIAGCFDA